MGLKGRARRALMKRIEAMPSVRAARERSDRISPAERAARKAAYSPASDEVAKEALAERLESDLSVAIGGRRPRRSS
jgi:hypothetical protein